MLLLLFRCGNPFDGQCGSECQCFSILHYLSSCSIVRWRTHHLRPITFRNSRLAEDLVDSNGRSRPTGGRRHSSSRLSQPEIRFNHSVRSFVRSFVDQRKEKIKSFSTDCWRSIWIFSPFDSHCSNLKWMTDQPESLVRWNVSLVLFADRSIRAKKNTPKERKVD